MLFPYSLPCNLLCGLPCISLKKASTNYRHDILSVNSQVIDQCMMTVQDRTVTEDFHLVIAERSFTVWLSICSRAVSCHSHFILSLCYHTGLVIMCLRYSFRSPCGPVSFSFWWYLCGWSSCHARCSGGSSTRYYTCLSTSYFKLILLPVYQFDHKWFSKSSSLVFIFFSFTLFSII